MLLVWVGPFVALATSFCGPLHEKRRDTEDIYSYVLADDMHVLCAGAEETACGLRLFDCLDDREYACVPRQDGQLVDLD